MLFDCVLTRKKAVGMGSDQMKGSLMFMVYTSSNGKNVTLSPRISDGHSEPSYTSDVTVDLLPGTGISNQTMIVNARCGNCRSWKGGSLNIDTTAENFIYASGPSGHLNEDSATAGIKRHSRYGTFQMDLTKATGIGGVPDPVSSNTEGTVQDSESTDHDFSASLHGAVMIFVFFGLMPIGVYILRIVGSPRYHGYNMAVSAGLGIIGAGLGIYAGSMYNRVSIQFSSQ